MTWPAAKIIFLSHTCIETGCGRDRFYKTEVKIKMTAWGRFIYMYKQRSVPIFSDLIAIPLVILSMLLVAAMGTGTSQAALSTSKVLNFQGRLLTTSGAVVPDGYYNMQFKIYHGGSGAAAGNPDGTLAWTESYVNNGSTSGILVRNGVFSVRLGSKNTFGSSVDWNQDTLWLSMNVAGTSPGCTDFGAAPCQADGEMLPMSRITSVPHAINSSAVGGKTVDQLIQLAQGVQTDASNNTSSIFINKTGTGNLVQFQNNEVDIFTITNTGNIALGSDTDKTISIEIADENEDGRSLALAAGAGGSGSGSAGGDLVMQGGDAGGTNGNAGNVKLDTGSATGDGVRGSIAIGEVNAGSISVGSSTQAISQTVLVGANDTAGSSTDVTVGSGAGADSGSTTIQAKDTVAIATNGTHRVVFAGNTNTVYFGNGVAASQPDDYKIQGTGSTTPAVAGGTLTMQGGNATAGNTNGGNVVLAGGSGSGTGSTGLVVLGTPVFSTVTNDPECYTGGSVVAKSCTISEESVDRASAVIVGFSATGKTATLPDPRNKTPGRVFYVMATGDSRPFTLAVNGGGSGNEISMHGNETATLMWNGNAWSVASSSNGATLQSVYERTPQNAGSTELVLNSKPDTGGLTIRDGGNNQLSDRLLEIKDSQSSTLFSVNNKLVTGSEHASDGAVSDGDNFQTNWQAVGSASVSRLTSDGQAGDDSAQVAAGDTADSGVRHRLSADPKVEASYRLSFYAKLTAGSAFLDLTARYTPDGGSTFVNCADYSERTVSMGEWVQVVCTIEADGTAVTDPYVYITQPTAPEEARTFLIDTLSFVVTPGSTSNVKIGDGDSEEATLFTVDKSAGTPTGGAHEELLGSMYYDTTIGKLQCYEAAGWGDCGASPDSFITLSPEYTNAVSHGEGVGEISSGFCSDTLSINDGSAGQPTICGTNETYNYYRWTSPEVTAQNHSIFITYKLPDNFKEFVPSSTALMGRTDGDGASAKYEIYKNNNTGLTGCGAAITVSTGSQSAWQKAGATGEADPASCGFSVGDSMVIRIDLTTAGSASAYVSNLSFAFSTL